MSGNQALVRHRAVHNVRLNFGFFHTDTWEGFTSEAYILPTTHEALLKTGAPYNVTFQETLKRAEDLKLWRLLYRDLIDVLTRGKVVLIGDAAHPCLPRQGQGGGMAIEDAGALGVLLSHVQAADEIEERLALFQKLRSDRVFAMQLFSRVPQQEVDKIADQVKKYY
ncbi:hypothetical protein LCI18_009274 [Fusarium solani-melongenae]|uniref:Uncharacterized protein n=1 Tax=Fusarium solani subsp. cucurbitae TaxID=2747967 RepID=A0ACD3ZAQ8_FUSSC|nr:hypothetical protein LCI18_009274 [Fusarium solani-melongenae]